LGAPDPVKASGQAVRALPTLAGILSQRRIRRLVAFSVKLVLTTVRFSLTVSKHPLVVELVETLAGPQEQRSRLPAVRRT
jgi:hypothetical protein